MQNADKELRLGKYGGAPITWKILAKEGGKTLVISQFALDCKPYDPAGTAVTWETCALRAWLNGAFLQEAFTAAERERIAAATVTADRNPQFGTDPGRDTTDRLFLLSLKEVTKYLPSDSARMCVPTDYAKACGAGTHSGYTVDGQPACWWWLRSPGLNDYYATYVNSNGSIYYVGYNVLRADRSVRPAMWLNP